MCINHIKGPIRPIELPPPPPHHQGRFRRVNACQRTSTRVNEASHSSGKRQDGMKREYLRSSLDSEGFQIFDCFRLRGKRGHSRHCSGWFSGTNQTIQRSPRRRSASALRRWMERQARPTGHDQKSLHPDGSCQHPFQDSALDAQAGEEGPPVEEAA